MTFPLSIVIVPSMEFQNEIKISIDAVVIILRYKDTEIVAYHCRRCHKTQQAIKGNVPEYCGACRKSGHHIVGANSTHDPKCDMCRLYCTIENKTRRARIGRPLKGAVNG